LITDILTDVDWRQACQGIGEDVEVKHVLPSFALANNRALQTDGIDDETCDDVSSIDRLEIG
jgi:hypothetical protein